MNYTFLTLLNTSNLFDLHSSYLSNYCDLLFLNIESNLRIYNGQMAAAGAAELFVYENAQIPLASSFRRQPENKIKFKNIFF